LLAAYRAVDPQAVGVDRVGRWPHVLDLAAPDIRPLSLGGNGYRYAIIAAAVPGLARCEREPEYTRARNVTGTLELARQLAEEGVTPVFFSSDNVFDGREGSYTDEAPTNPLNAYGSQKAEVERRLPEVTRGRYLIARLGKVYGMTRGNGSLLDEMAGQLAQGREVAAAHDQILSPVWVGDVVRGVLGLQEVGAIGLFNVCAPEVWSRFDLARAVAHALGVDAARVRGISLDDLKEPFRRPRRGDLLCRRLQAALTLEFQTMAESIVAIANQYQEAHR
jgi:dTDP-4-dehydrorhamnose reductase